MMGELSDRAELLKMKLEDKLKLQHSFRTVFQNPDGERVLRYLMTQCGLLSPEIITDPGKLLFRQGQQHIVLSTLRIINKNPKEIIRQIEESMRDENSH